MYRSKPDVEADVPVIKSLAKQMIDLSIKSEKEIFEDKERIKKTFDPKAFKKANKLLSRILKEIKAEAKKGERRLFWSKGSLFFGWMVPFAVANAICELLSKEGFKCRPVQSFSGEDEYYVNIEW